MSLVASEGPTSTLLPSVTRLAPVPGDPVRLELGPMTTALAALMVFLLSLVTVGSNSIILAAFYRYKRLRTASNCLLVSLAVSDFGVGVFMPLGTYLELADELDPEAGPSPSSSSSSSSGGFCVAPYCILITLCSVSVLVTVAIAVDRLTSLAQPLRYKNIITHSSIEKYIAVFWIYALAVGLSPLIYPKIADDGQHYSGSCRFNGVIMPPVRVFLFLAVWAPSAFILLGCYVYVYLVARAHARAIYTVELSFRNQTQTLALPRYGQTLAVTVGAFFLLWLPFQTCMLLDTFFGTNILSSSTIWLGLPILAHSGTNPWIYAFHHGEIRLAAGKVAEDLVSLFGVTPSRYYGCSPARRTSLRANLELAEVCSTEERRPAVEDCFAAKRHSLGCPSRIDLPDISPEGPELESSSGSLRQTDVVEEDIHDLAKMLEPKFMLDRGHLIDSNHNVERIKGLKYLLDPTFNKIRHLRRLNNNRNKRPLTTITGKRTSTMFQDTRFVSYQNLKLNNLGRRATVHLDTMSDPMLNNAPDDETPDYVDSEADYFQQSNYQQSPTMTISSRKVMKSLASVSDSNIRECANTNSTNDIELRRHYHTDRNGTIKENYRYSEQCILDNHHYYTEIPSRTESTQRCNSAASQRHRRSFGWLRVRQRFLPKRNDPPLELLFRQTSYTSLPTPEETAWSSSRASPRLRSSTKQLPILPNRLSDLLQSNGQSALTLDAPRSLRISSPTSPNVLVHSDGMGALTGVQSRGLLHPFRLMDSLQVPIVHSEPPSPIDPLPLEALQEENGAHRNVESKHPPLNRYHQPHQIRNGLRSPSRHSDPIIPSVLLNIEDCSSTNEEDDWSKRYSPTTSPCRSGYASPKVLSELLLLNCADRSVREPYGLCRLPEPGFPEHDCGTRFSSRRPSDSKWSESSRSQEVLSSVAEHPRSFPSSYSVNNFASCNSGSDINDLTASSCLEPFLCSDAALSSSLRESFFSAASGPDSEDIFTSFEEPEDESTSPVRPELRRANARCCASSVSLPRRPAALKQQHPPVQLEQLQSRSTECMSRTNIRHNERLCAILRIDQTNRRALGCKSSSRQLAPLATPTPTDVCTPTFDITVVATELKNEAGLGVRV